MKLVACLSFVVLVAGCGDDAAKPGNNDLAVSGLDAAVAVDLAPRPHDGGTCNPVESGWRRAGLRLGLSHRHRRREPAGRRL